MVGAGRPGRKDRAFHFGLELRMLHDIKGVKKSGDWLRHGLSSFLWSLLSEAERAPRDKILLPAAALSRGGRAALSPGYRPFWHSRPRAPKNFRDPLDRRKIIS